MPKEIIPYLRGLIQGYKITATYLAYQFGFSHDKITRVLRQKFSWRIVLVWMTQILFGVLSEGYLVIDDTVIVKPYARKIYGLLFAYSSSLDTVVYGYHVVFICWTNGTITIPLAWKFYVKNGQSKINLACQLLSGVKKLWKIKPKYVLFDSWYSASRLLDLIEAYHWRFVCQVKHNRTLSTIPIKDDVTQEGDTVTGLITNRCEVKVLQHENKYFITNHLDLGSNQTLKVYGIRWKIEEVFRFLKNQLQLECCQSRSRTAQETHLGSCLLAYLLIQKEQMETSNQTLYSVKQSWMLNRKHGLNRINHYVAKLVVA